MRAPLSFRAEGRSAPLSFRAKWRDSSASGPHGPSGRNDNKRPPFVIPGGATEGREVEESLLPPLDPAVASLEMTADAPHFDGMGLFANASFAVVKRICRECDGF